MTLWLIDQTAGAAFEEALTHAHSWTPTASQEAELEARVSALSGGTPRSFSLSGSTARIEVVGVLTPRPDLFAMFFGASGSSYAEIAASLRHANANSEVTDIELYLDSPGGQVSGLFECLADIQASTKPIRVVAAQACSAAYALAAAAGPIEAASPAATFGSIGVMATFRPSGGSITMRSTSAPLKNPSVESEEGKAEIQTYLDGMHDLFVGAIAEGRGIDASRVNSEYGKGAVLLAAQAQAKGMVDSIRRPQLRAITNKITASGAVSGASEQSIMDLKTLKLQHPELVEALVQQGIDQERERVCAHLEMGKQMDAQAVSLEAITAGTRVDHQPTLAKYFSISRNRRDESARAEDDTAVVEATSNAEAPQARDLGDQLEALTLGAKETK